MQKIFQEEYVDPFSPGHLAIRTEHYGRYAWAVKQLKKRLQPGATVYDIGCGGGYGSWLLYKAGFLVIGLDYSDELLAIARKKYPGPRYILFNLEEQNLAAFCKQKSLPEPAACVMLETLEHINNPEEVLSAMYDMLRKDGLVIASVPNEKFEPKKKGKPRNIHHKQLFSQRRFEQLFTENGFKISRMYGQPIANFLFHRFRWIYGILDVVGLSIKTISGLIARPQRYFVSWSYSFILLARK